jgi:hypothetical protein
MDLTDHRLKDGGEANFKLSPSLERLSNEQRASRLSVAGRPIE